MTTDHKPGAFCSDPCPVCNDTGTHTYWATIGRNRPTGQTLSTGEWQAFRSDLRHAAQLWGNEILATIDNGTSTWQGEIEQTFAVLFTIDPPFLPALRGTLGRHVRHYGQDAIGLVGGPGESLVLA